MKKNNLLGCLCIGLYLVSCTPAYEVELSTQYAAIRLNQEGYICEIVDNRTGKNYIPEHDFSPLLALYTGKGYINPIQLSQEGNQLRLTFSNQSEAVITQEVKDGYIRLCLESLSHRDSIEAIAWGPYSITISQYVGETVGVVRDSLFAIGVHPLEISTTEGAPHLGDDATGGFYINPLPGQHVPEELKDKIGHQVADIDVNREGDLPEYIRQIRGNAAVARPYGSDIQFFARDWRKDKIVDIYGRKQFIPAVDQDFIGSSIAFFATPSDVVLDVIGKIELAEGLPHPMIEGEWIKTRREVNPAYMLYEGGDLDHALDYADSCNFDLIHIGDVFKSWGHFDLHTSRFPGGAEEIKAFTNKARARGKQIGVHTLTMFTSTHDPYVSPIPSDSLCYSGSTTLSKAISASDTEIEIADNLYFTYFGETHSARIGNELIAYRSVTKEKPYKLVGCARGQYGTKPAAHEAGEQVDKPVSNCYNGFFPNLELQYTYAKRLAEVCNQTGIALMDFDGYYGGSPSGHGVMGASMFLQEWYAGLKDKGIISCGSSPFHYWWHIYSFMNWGEPWYDNLRESQVNYRLENQRYFERNLMPGMLGWFKLEQTYRPDDIEWIQARSAGFDAGYLLRVDESIEKNGFKSQLFEAIREWQYIRNNDLLTSAQREKMKDPKREFHLEKAGTGAWNLYEVKLKGDHVFKYRSVQTGEPLQGKFNFENPYIEQPVQFYAYVDAGDNPNATIQNPTLQIGGTEFTLLATLKAGNKLYCDGKQLFACDEYWKPFAQCDVPETAQWSKGENHIIVECTFSSTKSPSIRFEFKALSEPEKIQMGEK